MPYVLCTCGRPITAKGARLRGLPRAQLLSLGLAAVTLVEAKLADTTLLARMRAAEAAGWPVPDDAAALFEHDLRRRTAGGIPSRAQVALGNLASAWLQDTDVARAIDDALAAVEAAGATIEIPPATMPCDHRARATWPHGDPLDVLANGKKSTAKLKKLKKSLVTARGEAGPLYCVYFTSPSFDVVEVAFEPPTRTSSLSPSLARFLAVASTCRMTFANGNATTPLVDLDIDTRLRTDPEVAKRLGRATAIAFTDPDITVMHPDFTDVLGEPVITTLFPSFKKPRAAELAREGFGHYVLDAIAQFVNA